MAKQKFLVVYTNDYGDLESEVVNGNEDAVHDFLEDLSSEDIDFDEVDVFEVSHQYRVKETKDFELEEV